MGGRSPLLRTLLPRSDTAARISFNGRSATRSCERSTSPRASVNCILRTPGRPVDLERDALRESSRFHQIKGQVPAVAGKQPRALADDHRADKQGDLVDQLVVEEPTDQCPASVHHLRYEYFSPSRHRRPDLCPGLSGTSAVLDSTAQRCRARPGVGNGLRRRESNREDSDRPFNAQCGPVGAEIGVQLEDSRALVRPDRRPASTRPSRCAAHASRHPS